MLAPTAPTTAGAPAAQTAPSARITPITPPLVSCLRAVPQPVGAVLCVHPGGLPGRHYAALADALPGWSIHLADIGLSGVYWQGGDDPESAMPALVEEIRAAALAALPDGPLVLCGWSFGGAVAHALARAWPQQERIVLLTMLDSIAPAPGGDFGRSVRRRRLAARWFVQYMNAQKRSALRLVWWRPPRDEQQLLTDLLQQAIAQNVVAAGTTLPGFRKVFTSFAEGLLRNGRLAGALRLAPYAGRTLLIRARNGLLWRFRIVRHMGWRPYAPDLVVHSVDSDHYTLLTDTARMQDIGARIAAELRLRMPEPAISSTPR